MQQHGFILVTYAKGLFDEFLIKWGETVGRNHRKTSNVRLMYSTLNRTLQQYISFERASFRMISSRFIFPLSASLQIERISQQIVGKIMVVPTVREWTC